MTSVAGGVGAAACWGATTLLLVSVVRASSVPGLSFWFLLYNAAVVAPIALWAVSEYGLTIEGAALGVLAGALEAIGFLSYGRALQKGEVGIVAPLVSLEGIAAAALGVVSGDPLTTPVVVGALLATGGGLAVAMRGKQGNTTRGLADAVLAASLFGATLWLISESSVSIWLTLLIFNSVAALLLAVGSPRSVRRDALPGHGPLLAAAAFSVVGFASFTAGAQSGALAVTAVLAAQFSVVAALGAYFLWDERLYRHQLVGVVLLICGVAIAAAGSP